MRRQKEKKMRKGKINRKDALLTKVQILEGDIPFNNPQCPSYTLSQVPQVFQTREPRSAMASV
jgi:hypothetical protein